MLCCDDADLCACAGDPPETVVVTTTDRGRLELTRNLLASLAGLPVFVACAERGVPGTRFVQADDEAGLVRAAVRAFTGTSNVLFVAAHCVVLRDPLPDLLGRAGPVLRLDDDLLFVRAGADPDGPAEPLPTDLYGPLSDRSFVAVVPGGAADMRGRGLWALRDLDEVLEYLDGLGPTRLVFGTAGWGEDARYLDDLRFTTVLAASYDTSTWPVLTRDAPELPADVLGTAWDVVVVDDPPGEAPSDPGRLQSLFAAKRLAARHVVVTRADRRLEAQVVASLWPEGPVRTFEGGTAVFRNA